MKKRILIADDNQAILEVMELVLTEGGYEVTTTTDGKKVHKLAETQPDLILLDIWMSGSDGRDICMKLKHDQKTQNIPIILVSAIKDTEEKAELAGADDFLEKPFEIKDLLEKVAKYLG